MTEHDLDVLEARAEWEGATLELPHHPLLKAWLVDHPLYLTKRDEHALLEDLYVGYRASTATAQELMEVVHRRRSWAGSPYRGSFARPDLDRVAAIWQTLPEDVRVELRLGAEGAALAAREARAARWKAQDEARAAWEAAGVAERAARAEAQARAEEEEAAARALAISAHDARWGGQRAVYGGAALVLLVLSLAWSFWLLPVWAACLLRFMHLTRVVVGGCCLRSWCGTLSDGRRAASDGGGS